MYLPINNYFFKCKWTKYIIKRPKVTKWRKRKLIYMLPTRDLFQIDTVGGEGLEKDTQCE